MFTFSSFLNCQTKVMEGGWATQRQRMTECQKILNVTLNGSLYDCIELLIVNEA